MCSFSFLCHVSALAPLFGDPLHGARVAVACMKEQHHGIQQESNTLNSAYFTDRNVFTCSCLLNRFFVFVGIPINDIPINYVEMPEVTPHFELCDREKIFSSSKMCLGFQLHEAVEEHSCLHRGHFLTQAWNFQNTSILVFYPMLDTVQHLFLESGIIPLRTKGKIVPV